MSGLEPILISAVGGLVGQAISGSGGGGAPRVVTPPQVQVKPNTAVADALNARRGSFANNRTGNGGAEATGTGLKTKLGA